MKILYVLGFLPPYVTREIEAVADQGHRIAVLLPENKNDKTADFWDGISQEPGGSFVSISRNLKFDYLTCSHTKLLVPLLKSMGKTKALLKSLKEKEFRYFLIASRAVSTIPSSDKPDIIHAHFAKDQAHIARIMASILRVPYTVTTHATDIFVPSCKTRLRRVLGEASTVLTISDYNIPHLMEYGISRDKITVARLPLDTAKLPGRKSVTASAVCTASGLVPKKGVEVLVSAVRMLQQKQIKIKVTVIGSDPEGIVLRKYITESRDLPIDFAGTLNSSETLDIVASASFFVLPSVEAANKDKDGIPVALIEAMGMGVPCISTELSGIPELIENRVSGLLVQPGSAEELADAMMTLLSDRELAETLGRAGQKQVFTNHSPEKQAAIITDRFTEIVEERNHI